ncbi:Protein of unknown function [Bacillus wiedmannii]|nr:Protein of unknown function [Bacillus wiedmannii]
MRAIPLRLTP